MWWVALSGHALDPALRWISLYVPLDSHNSIRLTLALTARVASKLFGPLKRSLESYFCKLCLFFIQLDSNMSHRN
jgi:hypothetical protein